MGSGTFLNHNTESSPHRTQVDRPEWGQAKASNPDSTLGRDPMQGCFADHSGGRGQLCALGQAPGFCEPVSSFVCPLTGLIQFPELWWGSSGRRCEEVLKNNQAWCLNFTFALTHPAWMWIIQISMVTGHWESPARDLPPLCPDSGHMVEGPTPLSFLWGSSPCPAEHQPSHPARPTGRQGSQSTSSRHLAQFLSHRIMSLALPSSLLPPGPQWKGRIGPKAKGQALAMLLPAPWWVPCCWPWGFRWDSWDLWPPGCHLDQPCLSHLTGTPQGWD